MTDAHPETYRLPRMFRPVGLVMMIAFSLIVVWAFHFFTWSRFLSHLDIGFFLGSLTGAMFGVPLNASWAAMATTGFSFEGAIQGWLRYDWIGLVLAGPIGFVVGFVTALLPTFLLYPNQVLCGIVPFASVGTGDRVLAHGVQSAGIESAGVESSE